MTASVVILTGLNVWQWAALVLSSAFITAAAITTHRRDRRRRQERHR